MLSSKIALLLAEIEKLPVEIQTDAKEAFRQCQRDPHYPSLHFKKVQG